MGGKIFISYRRDDSSAWARLLYDRLFQKFPETKIFMDVDTIEPGVDGWKQRGATWYAPGFHQGSTDPVVGVSWDDAKAFCEWLTKQEHHSGILRKDMCYRLPKDEE
jgi:formylglycine-generating enzyme required for sulfatase activity